MKILYIPAQCLRNPELSKEALEKLPKLKFGIVASAQYIDKLNIVAEQIPNSIIVGKIIGCNIGNAIKRASDVEAFLFIGSGAFHPLPLLELGKPVWCWNPELQSLNQIWSKGKGLAKYKKFLSAKQIGIIASIKPGQFRINLALDLAKKLEEQGKEVYLFLADNIYQDEMVNWEIDFWLGTACPRIDLPNFMPFEELIFWERNK